MNSEFKTLYFTMVKKMWDIEDQLVRQLPKMAAQATSKELHDTLLAHQKETEEQRTRIGNILDANDEPEAGTANPSFEQMLREAEEEMVAITDPNVRDAYIIAAARSVEHLEMSKYMTLLDFAKAMEDSDAEEVFREILNEEEKADKKLAAVATGGFMGLMAEGVNEKAIA